MIIIKVHQLVRELSSDLRETALCFLEVDNVPNRIQVLGVYQQAFFFLDGK
jgi:hypothetical protein